MTKSIEIAAKKVDDAIKKGLEELGATLDEVEVVVLDAGGFLKKAKIRLTLEREDSPEAKPQEIAEPKKAPEAKPEVKREQKVTEKKVEKKSAPAEKAAKAEKPKAEQKPPKTEDEKQKPARVADEKAAENALEFVKNVIAKMGFDSATVTAFGGEILSVSAPDGDDSLIIGRHGETLSALSYLAETAARAEKSRINVTVDCNGYRDRRAASLAAMAKRRANECAAKHRKIRLEPMERIDRRTVHNALTGDDRVTTASEGKEPKRCVVIIPKNN